LASSATNAYPTFRVMKEREAIRKFFFISAVSTVPTCRQLIYFFFTVGVGAERVGDKKKLLPSLFIQYGTVVVCQSIYKIYASCIIMHCKTKCLRIFIYILVWHWRILNLIGYFRCSNARHDSLRLVRCAMIPVKVEYCTKQGMVYISYSIYKCAVPTSHRICSSLKIYTLKRVVVTVHESTTTRDRREPDSDSSVPSIWPVLCSHR
jgi:hypothetical protein